MVVCYHGGYTEVFDCVLCVYLWYSNYTSPTQLYIWLSKWVNCGHLHVPVTSVLSARIRLPKRAINLVGQAQSKAAPNDGYTDSPMLSRKYSMLIAAITLSRSKRYCGANIALAKNNDTLKSVCHRREQMRPASTVIAKFSLSIFELVEVQDLSSALSRE